MIDFEVELQKRRDQVREMVKQIFTKRPKNINIRIVEKDGYKYPDEGNEVVYTQIVSDGKAVFCNCERLSFESVEVGGYDGSDHDHTTVVMRREDKFISFPIYIKFLTPAGPINWNSRSVLRKVTSMSGDELEELVTASAA